jgi:hypothetical protein
MAVRYTGEQLKFLEDGYKQMAVRDLVPAFNKKFGRIISPGQIRSVLANHGFKVWPQESVDASEE